MNSVKIDIELNGKRRSGTLNIPECWDEVPRNVYPILSQIYLAEIADTERTVRAFLLLSGLQVAKSGIIKGLLAEEIYDLLPLVDWVFEKMDLKKNRVPRLVCKKKIYIGPDDGLKNMRFAEWVCADTYFTDYSSSKSAAALDKLIATIYRPEGKGAGHDPKKADYRGDLREKFNDSFIESRANDISSLPLFFRESIALWFASCRWQLRADYPGIFDADECDAADQNPMLAADGWFGIYDDLRGDPKFGGPDRLEEEYLHTIFQSLTRSHYKMKALKKEYGQ